jgi:NAD-dependent histone deacetylase SIR2
MKDYEAKMEWVELFREGEAPDCPACEERSE